MSMTDNDTNATVDSSSQSDNNHQHSHQHRHQHQHEHCHDRKRKRVSESESERQLEGEHRSKRIDSIDHTRTCAVDVLLHMTTFIEDKDVRSFAHTSKSNLSAMRRYEYKGTLWIVGHLLMYSKLLDEHIDDDSSGRSIFHPQLAFGQWSDIRIIGDQLNLFHSWRIEQSNQSSVKLLIDYIQSREMIRLHSPSLSLTLVDFTQLSSLTSLKWLMQMLPICVYKLRILHQCNESSLSWRDFKLLHDIVPHWDNIQVLGVWSLKEIKDFIQPNCRFPSSLTELQLESWEYDWSQVVLPTSLKTFQLCCNLNCSTDKWPQIPPTLETLVLRGYGRSLENYRLPPSLTQLQIEFHQVRGSHALTLSLKKCRLPSTLKLLKMDGPCNLPVDGLDALPDSLETLEFGYRFNQPLDQIKLPSSLQSLLFGWCFDYFIDGLVLPQSLTHLDLGCKFNQPIRGDIFPPQLKSLILGYSFNQLIHEWKLPNSLTQLQFGVSFWQQICGLPLDYWPSALTQLSWWQYPIKWIPLTSSAPYDTPFTSELTSTHRGNPRDESLDHYHSFKAKANANGNGMLKPIFDRTTCRQEMCAYDRNDVIRMLANVRQAELNDFAE